MLEGVLGDPDAIVIPGAYHGYESVEASSDEQEAVDDKLENITRDLARMHVGAFRGKSSGAAIVQATLEIRAEVSGVDTGPPTFVQMKRPEYWEIREVCAFLQIILLNSQRQTVGEGRGGAARAWIQVSRAGSHVEPCRRIFRSH